MKIEKANPITRFREPDFISNNFYDLSSTVNVFGRRFECYKVYNPYNKNSFVGVILKMLPSNEDSQDGVENFILLEKLISYGLDESSPLEEYKELFLAMKENKPI